MKPPSSAPSHFGLLLLAATLALSGSLVGIEAWALASGRASAQHQAEVEAQNLAQSLERDLAATLQRIDHSLETLALVAGERLSSRNPRRTELQAVLTREGNLLPQTATLQVTDEEGRILVDSRGPATGDLRGRPFFSHLQARSEAGLITSQPYREKAEWKIAFARRWSLPGGRFGGVVAVSVPLEHLQNSLQGYLVGTSGMLTLRNSEAGFLARQPREVRGRTLPIGDRTISPELQRILESGVPQATYLASAPFDGTRRTLSFRRIEGYPLFVVASLAEDDYLAHWRKQRNASLALVAIGLLGGWVLAVFLWRSGLARERSAQAMLASQAQFRTYVEQSIDVIFTLDANGIFEFVSPAWERQFGFPREEVLGRPFAPFVHPEDVLPCMEYLQRVIASGESLASPPYRVQHADGSWRWFRANGSRMATSDGTLRYMGVGRDITEHRAADEALKEREEQLRVIFEASEAGIILVSPQGELRFANRRMAEMFGMPLEELIGTSYGNHLHPSDYREGEAKMRQLILGEIQSVSLERHYLRKDGSDFWGHLSGRRLENPDGSLRALVGVITDITERRQGEAERHALMAQLHQTQKMDSLGSLAGGVAHDMNNVLAAILGLAEANRENQPPESRTHRAFDTIAKAALRGAQMVKRLLAFARQNPVELSELDLNAILREELHLLERTTFSRVRLTVDLAPDLHPIHGDASALTHAFMNLCLNAVDAMADSGVLTLRTVNLDEGWIEAQVIDTGTGMPQEVLERAMDPFFTTKPQGKGTGLGLSMVYSTVKAHRGQMEIQSEPGQGTCVRIRFPAVRPQQGAAAPAVQESAVPLLRPLTILLVDDDDLVRASTQAILDHLGQRPVAVGNGEEALAALQAGLEVDGVILDLNMPGLGGAETLARLRDLYPKLPVLLATGRADQAAQELAQRYPGVTLLPKPIALAALQQQVERLGRA